MATGSSKVAADTGWKIVGAGGPPLIERTEASVTTPTTTRSRAEASPSRKCWPMGFRPGHHFAAAAMETSTAFLSCTLSGSNHRPSRR